ncbi:MAG: hypothetical protein K0Q70_54 [Rhodospirillales bacterium]|jgi:ElaB/YqjD/DUF883 family membrane-anchored ribosome-binding protein|nr:hypothetical protein [Rhodospirillales bacterium]
MNEVRSPEQIERDISELRAQISDTLDAVQHKLSPGQLLDQALSYAKDGGAVAANIGRGMRDNPIPASLFGLSLAWLWYSGSRNERVDERPSENLREARDSLERAGRDLQDAQDATVSYVRNNPVTTAAAALAVGALIGALLPRRRK